MMIKAEVSGVEVVSHRVRPEDPNFEAEASLIPGNPKYPATTDFVSIRVSLGENLMKSYVDLDEIDASIATFENLVGELVTIRNSPEEKSDDA